MGDDLVIVIKVVMIGERKFMVQWLNLIQFSVLFIFVLFIVHCLHSYVILFGFQILSASSLHSGCVYYCMLQYDNLFSCISDWIRFEIPQLLVPQIPSISWCIVISLVYHVSSYHKKLKHSSYSTKNYVTPALTGCP